MFQILHYDFVLGSHVEFTVFFEDFPSKSKDFSIELKDGRVFISDDYNEFLSEIEDIYGGDVSSQLEQFVDFQISLLFMNIERFSFKQVEGQDNSEKFSGNILYGRLVQEMLSVHEGVLVQLEEHARFSGNTSVSTPLLLKLEQGRRLKDLHKQYGNKPADAYFEEFISFYSDDVKVFTKNNILVTKPLKKAKKLKVACSSARLSILALKEKELWTRSDIVKAGLITSEELVSLCELSDLEDAVSKAYLIIKGRVDSYSVLLGVDVSVSLPRFEEKCKNALRYYLRRRVGVSVC